VIPIDDEASVSVLRQHLREVGEGLDPELVARAATVASELGHNQLRYGKLGEVAVHRHPAGLELVASDSGPGLRQPSRAFSGDGHISHQGLGIGLAGVRRQSDGLDVQSRRNEGLLIRARFGTFSPHIREAVLLGHPHPQEWHSGDDGAVIRTETAQIAVLADGLGHGPAAREAARLALHTVRSNADLPPVEILELCDRALRRTRGAAMAIARIQGDTVTIGIAGNVRAVVLRPRDAIRVPAISRVVGIGRGRRFAQTEHPLLGATLLLASDCLPERVLPTSLVRPGWPLSLADQLIQEHGRDNDDVTVLAMR